MDVTESGVALNHRYYVVFMKSGQYMISVSDMDCFVQIQMQRQTNTANTIEKNHIANKCRQQATRGFNTSNLSLALDSIKWFSTLVSFNESHFFFVRRPRHIEHGPLYHHKIDNSLLVNANGDKRCSLKLDFWIYYYH